MKIPVYKTEGIIIRRFNSGEFDTLLVVYTKEFGKILVKAKSLRKKAAKLKETLELFSQVHLMLARGKNIDTVVGAAINNCFPNLRRHLPAISALYYISELIDKMVVAPEKDARIWDITAKSFYFLEEKQRSESIIRKLINKFEYNLLAYLGHQPAKKEKNYLDLVQYIIGARIESQAFLLKVLAG